VAQIATRIALSRDEVRADPSSEKRTSSSNAIVTDVAGH
jgi:hypothetical protein